MTEHNSTNNTLANSNTGVDIEEHFIARQITGQMMLNNELIAIAQSTATEVWNELIEQERTDTLDELKILTQKNKYIEDLLTLKELQINALQLQLMRQDELYEIFNANKFCNLSIHKELNIDIHNIESEKATVLSSTESFATCNNSQTDILPKESGKSNLKPNTSHKINTIFQNRNTSLTQKQSKNIPHFYRMNMANTFKIPNIPRVPLRMALE